MQEFVHHKIEVYTDFLQKFNSLQILLGSRSYDFERNLEVFFNLLLAFFQTNGNTAVESEILKIMNTISIVKKGFNPVKMEKIEVDRRALYWGFAFAATEALSDILMKLLDKEKLKLEEGDALISNLILMLIQNNLLDDMKINDLNTIEKIEIYWAHIISQNESIAGINKKLRMSLSPEDIYLLVEKNLAKISL